MAVDSCVIDTNVLVYSTVLGNPWHNQARKWLAKLQDEGSHLCIPTQLLREYLVVLTRKSVFEKSFTVDQVLAQLEALLSNVTILDESSQVVGLLCG